MSGATVVEGSGGASMQNLVKSVLANATATGRFGNAGLTFAPTDSNQVSRYCYRPCDGVSTGYRAQDVRPVRSKLGLHCDFAASVLSGAAFSGGQARCVCAGEAGCRNSELRICYVYPPAHGSGAGPSQQVNHCCPCAPQGLPVSPVSPQPVHIQSRTTQSESVLLSIEKCQQ